LPPGPATFHVGLVTESGAQAGFTVSVAVLPSNPFSLRLSPRDNFVTGTFSARAVKSGGAYQTDVTVTLSNGDAAAVAVRQGFRWEFWDGGVGSGTLVEQGTGQEEPAVRPSTLVSRDDLPGVRAREEINVLLRAHDPEVAEANLARLTDEYSPLLRRIAREPDVTGRDPSLRRNAITALGRLISVDNLNVLTELATGDDDELIRGSALTVLAGSGLLLAAPLLADAQNSREPVEAVAARKGLAALADRLSPDAVETVLRRGQRRERGQRRAAPPETTRGETARDTGH
jgi:hypothetical protein